MPVSVKTRLGYDAVVIEDWVSVLLEERPEVISIHGRTLMQMYRGRADWGAIARAAKLIRQTSTLVLGNGDVESLQDLVARVQETKVHGVLIGRGALGNPWIFRAKEWARAQATHRGQSPYFPETVPLPERFQVALEHARYFESLGEAGGKIRIVDLAGGQAQHLFPRVAQAAASRSLTSSRYAALESG